MEYKERDPVKLVIWAVIIGGLILGLFVENGPQAVVNGIRFGSILMLGAIGITLIFRILNFANFSHGDILLVGAYTGLWADWAMVEILPRIVPALGDPANGALLRWSAFGIALVLAVVLTALVAIIVDRILYRHMRRSNVAVLIIASFGVSLFLRNLVNAVWGVSNQRYAMRIQLPQTIDVGLFEFNITTIGIVTIVVAVTLVTLLHLFLNHTRTGKAMRAMSDNMDLARITGIDTEHMIKWTWGIAAGLAAVAGMFMGLNFGAFTPNLGFRILLPLFAAAILGGVGSPYGAMLGGLVIGIAQNLLVAPVTGIASGYKPAVAFVLMIAMLLIRPQGLLGQRERKG